MSQPGDSLDSDFMNLLNTTVSSASKFEQKTIYAPASVTVINSEEINRYGYQTLADVLNSQTGFFFRNDRMYSSIGARGFDRPSSYMNKILLLIDGQVFNESVYGSIEVGNELGINLKAIDKIEIVRGPGSALYGTGAMHAVINIITKKGIDVDGFNFGLQYGSFGSLEGSYFIGKELTNDLQFSLSGKVGKVQGHDYYFKEFDTDSTNYGWSRGHDAENFYQSLMKVNYKNFQLSGMFVSRAKDIPTAPWNTTFNSAGTDFIDQTALLALSYNENLTKNQNLKLQTYLGYYNYHGSYLYTDYSTQYEKNLGLWFGADIQYQWDITLRNRLISGVENKYSTKASYQFWDKTTTFFDNNFPYNLFSIYLQDSYQFLDNLNFTAGLRYDNNSLFKGDISPRLALIYSPFSSSTFKLLYGRAFRSPNIYEAFYEDTQSQMPNPKLKPEYITTTEMIYEQQFQKFFTLRLCAFYYKMNNLIDQIKLSDTSDIVQFQNINKVDAYGFEADLNARFTSGLWSYLNFSHAFVKDIDTKEKLTNSPSFLIRAGISQKLLKHFIISFEAFAESKRITVSRMESSSFFLLNVFIAFNPKFGNENTLSDLVNKTKLSLKFSNLFNTKYSLPSGYETRQDVLLQDGLGMYLNFGINF